MSNAVSITWPSFHEGGHDRDRGWAGTAATLDSKGPAYNRREEPRSVGSSALRTRNEETEMTSEIAYIESQSLRKSGGFRSVLVRSCRDEYDTTCPGGDERCSDSSLFWHTGRAPVHRPQAGVECALDVIE